jgi:hypothetical protein
MISHLCLGHRNQVQPGRFIVLSEMPSYVSSLVLLHVNHIAGELARESANVRISDPHCEFHFACPALQTLIMRHVVPSTKRVPILYDPLDPQC